MNWNVFHQAVKNIRKLLHSSNMSRSTEVVVFGIEICTTVCKSIMYERVSKQYCLLCDYICTFTSLVIKQGHHSIKTYLLTSSVIISVLFFLAA